MRLLVGGCYQTYPFATELYFSGVKKAVENTVEVKLHLPLCIGIFFKSSEKKIYSSIVF